jgi:hypothetical protein
LEGLIVMKMQAQQNTNGIGRQYGGSANGSVSSVGLLNQKEAARFLHVQPRTLESWRQRRIGPRFVRYSMRCVRYRAQDLQAWLDNQSIDTESCDRE